jgi:4-alpha-glucanotransferase
MPPAVDTTDGVAALSIATVDTDASAESNGGMLRIRFAVTAPTRFGESVVLTGASSPLGSFDLSAAVPMLFEHPGVWVAELDHPRTATPVLYRYAVTGSDRSAAVVEPGAPRALSTHIAALQGGYLVRDALRTGPDASREIFGTAAFTDVVFRRPLSARKGAKIAAAEDAAAVTRAIVMGKGAYVARFSVFAERVRVNDEVCIVGVTADGEPLPMQDCESPDWSVCLAMPPPPPAHHAVNHHHRVAYKFIIRSKATKEVVVTDTVDRVVEFNRQDEEYIERNAGTAAIIFLSNSEKSLSYPTPWRGSGIAIPVFSLRSKTSCGVGEFKDLTAMVDLCVATGYQMLQLLPVNDTTSFNSWRDSYPYSAVSCFALHPQYLSIDLLGNMPAVLAKEYDTDRTALNALPEVDYERMMAVKMRYITKMYQTHKQEFFKSRDFQTWFESNKAWLVPYALFRFLMQVNGSSNFDNWGARKSMSLAAMEEMSAQDTFHFDYIGLAYYTQFHLFKQLTAASDYAAKHQVVFKGDLPIGVNRHCVDTWVNPHLFRLHMQAGAPPDFFATNGQNWFFPTYDWDAMAMDGYGWWRARLGQMSKYFAAFRIDHILGFFRIWEIPESFRTGMSGRMFPALPIAKSTLESQGLWDLHRLAMPYIRDSLLQDMFGGDEWWKIKDRFFVPLYHDRLRFKDEFDTEKKCEAELALPEGTDDALVAKHAKILQHLFTLHNNVCLLADVADPDMYHPRFMMQDTSSFHELPDAHWKASLKDLYKDYFFHRQENLWRKSGLEKLPMMKAASNMLVCGEDLGFTPTSVPEVMKETSIMSLKVQRMPGDDVLYGIPAEYPHACVATTSSHDTPTFRGWWEEIPATVRQDYWSKLMNRRGGAPEECSPEIAEWAIVDHLKCPAMWTVFPLQDLLAIDGDLRRKVAAEEQINNPANSMHYWRFRLHLPIEDVMAKSSFINKLRSLNLDNARGQTY